MVSFENFVKSMPPSLSELKFTPSFCFAFEIPDDPTATNNHVGPKISAKIKIYIHTRAELLCPLSYEIHCIFLGIGSLFLIWNNNISNVGSRYLDQKSLWSEPFNFMKHNIKYGGSLWRKIQSMTTIVEQS